MKTYTETLYDAYGQEFSVDKVYFENKTEHQHLIIFENAMFGRVMALDGIIQTTEADEFIYHEMLTHVPLLAHGNVKDVLIIGGGDGGMLREVCKHQSVEHIVQVEIDDQVVEMCKEYLPQHSAGAYDDPRVEVVIDDGANFVRTTERRFDVIISDSTDPIGPGDVLFTSDFYADCKKCLKLGGVLVTQNGVAYMQLDEVVTTGKRLAPYFRDSYFYSAAVPTYIGGIMTFAWATDDESLRQLSTEVIAERFNKAAITTRYYNPAIHSASFALPQYILDAIKD
ncbi:MAG: polyamine aminopropyltransferase [Gammaproteobacteria bacterium]|nr:polyamine aminopropyltransferase [Gammaproteobacteria bacterium]